MRIHYLVGGSRAIRLSRMAAAHFRRGYRRQNSAGSGAAADRGRRWLLHNETQKRAKAKTNHPMMNARPPPTSQKPTRRQEHGRPPCAAAAATMRDERLVSRGGCRGTSGGNTFTAKPPRTPRRGTTDITEVGGGSQRRKNIEHSTSKIGIVCSLCPLLSRLKRPPFFHRFSSCLTGGQPVTLRRQSPTQ